MHEAKVDVVTVPNLSEHLSSAETTAQLSARFGTAAAMTSINNLLLLGDGETWNRQIKDVVGPREMVRTVLQAATPPPRDASPGSVAGGSLGDGRSWQGGHAQRSLVGWPAEGRATRATPTTWLPRARGRNAAPR